MQMSRETPWQYPDNVGQPQCQSPPSPNCTIQILRFSYTDQRAPPRHHDPANRSINCALPVEDEDSDNGFDENDNVEEEEEDRVGLGALRRRSSARAMSAFAIIPRAMRLRMERSPRDWGF